MKPINESSGSNPRTFIEQARRAQVVEAAAQVVAEAGYARASLARIAEHAGISKGVLTYHFSSKDEILREVVTGFFNRGWERMEARIEAEETAIGKVRAWIGAELDFFAGHRVEFLAMSDIVANHRGQDGEHAYAGEFAEELDGLTEILAAGQAAGELRDFDPRVVAGIIVRCTDGVLTAWALDATVDLSAQAAELLNFIDHAIRGDSP